MLRLFMGVLAANRRGGGKEESLDFSSPAPAVSFSEISPSPSAGGGFREIAERTPSLSFFAAATLLSALLSLLPAATAFSALTVDNTARASYSLDAVPVAVVSNRVSVVVRTPSTIEFLKYAPLAPDAEIVNVSATSYLASDAFAPLPRPIPLGAAAPLDLGQPVPLVETSVYHENEPIFIRLTDLDQNLDPAARETVAIVLSLSDNQDRETLLLTETGPDTGVFAGSIQSTGGAAAAGDGQLSVGLNSTIQARYSDPADGTDTSTTAALVDPFGVVFDTTTGLPVNGAVVTLIDAATGLPAQVLGDDGISLFPASVTSGGTAADSSGRLYTFRPGFYRFPFIQPGRYILSVTPPPAYRAPSAVSTADIQNLPGAPFAIVSPGSRGEEFLVNPGPAIHIDIPVDPLRFSLYLTKAASKQQVSIGDFLQYRITVENTAVNDANGVLVNDHLPLGFRYRKGSTKIDGGAAADPSVAADGRTLLFDIGIVAAGKTSIITYVVEVAAGARLGRAENTATATAGGVGSSNTAKAEVVVKEDLFQSKSIIMGRVFPDGCGEAEGNTEGLAGVRIYLEDGTYVVTDKQGMYHFEGLEPGTHVVQLDLETVPKDYQLVACEENDRFAGTPHSQFVDLQGGTLWRADFYTAPKPPVVLNGSVGIELRSVLRPGRPAPELVDYTVAMPVGEVAVGNLRLTVMLPEGVFYQPGSSALDGAALPDPEVMDNVLTYRLGDAPAGWEGRVAFTGRVAAAGGDSELPTRALLTFDSGEARNRRTPVVENILQRRSEEERTPTPDVTLRPLFEEFGHTLSEADRLVLDGVIADLKSASVTRIFVTGHTNTTRIAPRSRHIFADNYELSRARAKSVADYLTAGLALSPEQIISDGRGPDEPVASNETAEGRALNRRVELRILSEKVVHWSELKNVKERSGIQQVEITGLQMAEKSAAEKAGEERSKARTMPEFDRTWLNQQTPGLAFAWPYQGFYPPLPSVKIAVKHNPAKPLKLLLNGTEVDPLYLDGTVKSSDSALALSLWIGIHIADGDNLFEAIEYAQDGSEVQRIGHTIHYSGNPVKAELVAEQSRLTADGKTPPVIAVRLTDKAGHPARKGVVGEYSLEPPYLPLQKVAELQQDPLTMSKSERLKYVVGEDGIALIELQPTTTTGEAVLRFRLVTGENEVRAWLTAGERDWILVGLAEGTAGYNAVSGNTENLRGSAAEEHYYEDGRLAFFAKGMVKGKWLLTLAYDSDKPDRKDKELFQIIDPDAYYTLYGDASQQSYEAASAEKIYLKLEREQFYALFGDYTTGLSQTELAGYSRSLTGLKAEYSGEYATFNVFASDTDQGFVKDEIRGDGTSGLYRLSRRDIVLNSEKVTIEVRDRFRSEVILSSRELSRHVDYNIDYTDGTLFFKQPIPSRDESFNPIHIVVDYEVSGQGESSLNYGGRGAVRWPAKGLEVGASAIHEEMDNAEGDLYGLDATWEITEKTRLRAEVATSDSKTPGEARDGGAWLAELAHRSEHLDGKLYVRELETGFGLGQQRGSEEGTRKFGADGIYRLNPDLSLGGTIYRQGNLETDAVRDVAQTDLTFQARRYSLSTGLRYAEDAFENGEKERSTQLLLGGTVQPFERLLLRAAHEQSIAGNNESGDFPTRTTVGADFKLTAATTLFMAQEFTRGDDADTQNTRIGFKATPWTGGTLGSSLERQTGEYGPRMFALFGLNQSWQLSERWSLSGSLDRSHTVREPEAEDFDTDVPPASGDSEDFTAVSLGATCKLAKWSWANRLEFRDAETEEKWGLFSGLAGEVHEGLGLSARTQIFLTDGAAAEKTDGELRLGLAYRPFASRWIVLDRLDFLFEENRGEGFHFDGWRLVNNLNANYKPNRKTQISLQYGAKYVQESIEGQDYGSFTDLVGVEGRYDVTRRWDVGVRGSVLHSWRSELLDYGSGISVGCNVVENVWISAGYNFIGFQDEDFSRADFTAQGPFVKFRLKFDQHSVRDLLKQI